MDLFVSYDPEFTGTSLVVCAHLTGGQPHAPRRAAQRLAFAIWQHISVTRPLLANWRTGKRSRFAPLRALYINRVQILFMALRVQPIGSLIYDELEGRDSEGDVA